MSEFIRAIVKPPSRNFAKGLTQSDLGSPDYTLALEQHTAYVEALNACGLTLVKLPADEEFPDSTFVEDTAITTDRFALLTRPGAETRRGEVSAINSVLSEFYADIRFIAPPGTVDGGDVCEAGNHYFIGVSRRTNETGARQLSSVLGEFGYTASLIDIRKIDNILHLKSGLAYLGDNHLVAIDALSQEPEFRAFRILTPATEEDYAANCVLVNGNVLLAAGYSRFEEKVCRLGFKTIALEMSEFRKMDGGLSCLSIRF